MMESRLFLSSVIFLLLIECGRSHGVPRCWRNKINENAPSCRKLWQCFSLDLEEGSELTRSLSNVSSVCESQTKATNGYYQYGWRKFRKTCQSGPYIDILIGNQIEPGEKGDYHLCMLTGLGLFDSDVGINFASLADFVRKVKGREQHKQTVEKVAFDCGKRIIPALPMLDKLKQFQDCLITTKVCP